MKALAGPVEGGGFRDREAKVPIHELASGVSPLVENLGGGFTIRISIGAQPKNIVKFPKVPTIPIEIRVPELDSQSLSVDGWEYATISLNFEYQTVQMNIKGKFGRNEDEFYYVNLMFSRIGTGDTENDSVTIEDKDGNSSSTSIFDLMQIRLKSGDPKFARFSDQYPSLDVEGVMAMLTRYMKDYVRQQQQAAPDVSAVAGVNPQMPGNGGVQ